MLTLLLMINPRLLDRDRPARPVASHKKRFGVIPENPCQISSMQDLQPVQSAC